ncbi:MAG: ABC transporter substrate-binding protein [Clostridia bacterium]|nr:ABC transporter substrate-binding protein [Clostridia bacterium]
MKKTARFLSLMIATLMVVLSFAGCGAADNSNVFVLGISGPMTGTASTYGNAVVNGAQIAVDKINAAGGINGYKIKLIYQDDEATVDKAKTAYEKLMDNGMQVFIGCVTSDSSIACNDLIKADGILQITPSASAIEAAVNPNSFRVCFTDPLQGTKMAEYVYNTLGYRKAAACYNQDDSYSTGMYDAFKERFTELGGKIAVEAPFGKDTSDFNAQITKVASSGADFIYLPIYAEKAAQILITADSKGVKLPFVGGDGLDGIMNYLTGDLGKLAENLIFLTPFVSTDTDPKVQAFTNTFIEKYDMTPDQFAADAYDAVYLAKLAIEQAGITAPTAMDNAAVVAAMTQIELDGLTGKMTFDASGEPNKDAKVAKIINGEYVAQ